MSSKIDFTVSEDTQLVTMTLSNDEAPDTPITVPLTREQVTQLVQVLGHVRETLLKDEEVPPIEGARFNPVVRTRWALQPEASTDGSLLAFQHPAYGPVGLVLPPLDADRLMQGLQLHHEMRRKQQPARGKLN